MPFPPEYELNRFYPQRLLPVINAQGAAKLSEARILVIGAGSMGSAAIMRLAESGTGAIGIADSGKAEKNGISNSITSGTRDTGRFKACTAAEKVKTINPDCRVNIYNAGITPDNIIDIISDYDIVIDCSDNIPTHLLTGDATELIEIPLVTAAAGGVNGQVSVFNYNGGPACRSLLPVTLSSDDTITPESKPYPEQIAGITGSIQAFEAIKIATGEGEILSSKILRVDAENMCADITAFSQPDDYQPSGIRGDYGFEYLPPALSISPSDLKNELEQGQKVALFDIRTAEDYEKFNIGGTNVKTEYLLNNPEALPADCMIVIICDTGDESMAVAEYLQNDTGLSDIYSLEGGIRHWRETIF